MYNSFKNKNKIKIAIITNIPTPYRKKQWEYYSKCEYLDITVFYCSKIEKDRQWEVDSASGIKEVFLNGFSYKNYHFNPGVLKVIFQNYDLFMIGGYGYPSLIMAIIALKLLKKPWVMLIDGISPLKLKNDTSFFKKFLITGADAYFANGIVGAKFLKKYKIKDEKIFNQYMTVDVNHFMNKKIHLRQIRNEIRRKYGINKESVLIMYAGRLIYNKGVQDLIESFKILESNGKEIKAIIVGEGNYKYELKKKAANLKSDIIFTGHVNPKELYKYYYASDIFVLPTYNDLWGLVVNEAMACGLPVIVTEAAGCSLDLVKNNGYVVKNHSTIELNQAIEDLIDKNKFEEFGNNSRKIINKWTFKESLNSFIKILKYINKSKTNETLDLKCDENGSK